MLPLITLLTAIADVLVLNTSLATSPPLKLSTGAPVELTLLVEKAFCRKPSMHGRTAPMAPSTMDTSADAPVDSRTNAARPPTPQ